MPGIRRGSKWECTGRPVRPVEPVRPVPPVKPVSTEGNEMCWDGFQHCYVRWEVLMSEVKPPHTSYHDGKFTCQVLEDVTRGKGTDLKGLWRP